MEKRPCMGFDFVHGNRPASGHSPSGKFTVPSGLTLGTSSTYENESEFSKTHPTISWTNEDYTSFKYQLYREGETTSFENGSGTGCNHAAKISGWMTMNGASEPTRTYNKIDVAFGETGPWASLNINLTFNQVESSIPFTVVPIENPYSEEPLGPYYKIQGLPDDTSVDFWYASEHGPTQGASINSDGNGVLLFYDYAEGSGWHYGLGDNAVAAGDQYCIDVFETVKNGEALTCTITRHPLNIVFDQRAAQNLSFATATEVTMTYGNSAFTNLATNNTVGGGAITYSSGNTNVATVDPATGKVTIIGAGSATITATAAATGNDSDDYRETAVSYTLTVSKKAVTASYGGAAITKTYDSNTAVKAGGQTATQLDLAISSGLVGDALTVKLNNPVYFSTNTGTGIGITGTLSVTGTGSGNYQVTPSVTGAITKATPTASDFQIALPSALYVGDSVSTAITPKAGLTGMGAVTAQTGTNGTASASVTQSQVTSAIEKAQAAAKNSGEAPSVEIHVSGGSNANAVQTSIPKASVQAMASGKMASMTLSSSVAAMTFDAQAISAIAGAASGDVAFAASKVDNSILSDTVRQTVGNHPVYNFSVTSGGSTISQFGGTVTVSVPYTPAAGENPDAIVAYYINANGEPELMQNCRYDAQTGTLVFTTTHFSTYAVGYNKVAFSDVAEDAWCYDAVTFLAARGITGGTAETTFSPNATLTRGQFITLVMRAYGIEPDESAADNFSDAGDTYYTGYLAAAKRLGISNGVGGNKFAPKQAVSRQQMFTLLYNALKAIDQPPKGDSGKTLSDFTDSANISSYAQEAVENLVKSGAVSGSNGNLRPTATTTRAQMAQVLYNLLDK